MKCNLKFLPLITSAEDACVAFLTLERPKAANALDAELQEALLVALARVSDKRNCRALVLRGEGKNFCAGADLPWMLWASQLPSAKNRKEAERFGAVFFSLYSLPMPTIAVVQGAAVGGGAGLVAACDWAVAEEGAFFALAEARLGLVAASLLPYFAERLAPAELRRLLATGTRIGAEEALRMGLVQKVVAKRKLEKVLREDLAAICAGSAEAQKISKELLKKLYQGKSFKQEQLAHMLADSRALPTAREGLTAAYEKRSPTWRALLGKNRLLS